MCLAMHRSLAVPGVGAHHVPMAARYRPNVAAIIRRTDGRILIARRSDYPESWQFPQGGISRNEKPEEALKREVAEEIALTPQSYRITAERAGYRYDFPTGPDRRGFHGQQQTYFLCELKEGAEGEVVPQQGCGEFTEAAWVLPDAFPFDLVPPMKRAVYRRVLRDFFG